MPRNDAVQFAVAVATTRQTIAARFLQCPGADCFPRAISILQSHLFPLLSKH